MRLRKAPENSEKDQAFAWIERQLRWEREIAAMRADQPVRTATLENERRAA